MNRNSNWYKLMLAKYGTEEAIREVMRNNGNKSKRNTGGTGGFAKLTEAERKEVSKLGVEARKRLAREV